jgi:hypothetical protein
MAGCMCVSCKCGEWLATDCRRVAVTFELPDEVASEALVTLLVPSSSLAEMSTMNNNEDDVPHDDDMDLDENDIHADVSPALLLFVRDATV